MSEWRGPHCDEALLCRYLDGDLDGDEWQRMVAHLDTCASCAHQARTLSAFGEAFRQRVRHAADRVDFADLEKTVVGHALRQRHAQYGRPTRFRVLRTMVPATIGAALLIFLGYSMLMPPSPAPPSAVIMSFTGSMSSVMIFETPETRQTILWYTEDTDLESEPDAG